MARTMPTLVAATLLVASALAADIKTKDGDLTFVVSDGNKVGYKIGNQQSVYFEDFAGSIKSENAAAAAFLRAGMDMGAKLGKAENAKALVDLQAAIVKQVDAKVKVVTDEVQIVKTAGTGFSQQVIAVGGACMAGTCEMGGNDHITVGIAGSHTPFVFEGAYTCVFTRPSDKYVATSLSKANPAGVGSNAILCPTPAYPMKMTYKEKAWKAALSVQISGKVLGMFNGLNPTIPFTTAAPALAFRNDTYTYTDSAMLNKANKIEIEIDFADTDTFSKDIKFKLTSSKQTTVKDASMAIKVDSFTTAVLSFTTEKLSKTTDTVFTIQATDNHGHTSETKATVIFDLAVIFTPARTISAQGCKNCWDEKGLFWYLGTLGQKRTTWTNPWKLGLVALNRSPYYSSQKENGIFLTRPEAVGGKGTYEAWTSSTGGLWWFTLKGGRTLSMSHYTLRQSNQGGYLPRAWKIECYDLAAKKWIILDDRKSTVINGAKVSVTYAVNQYWPTAGKTQHAPMCAQFRLRQESGKWQTFAGFEAYGTYVGDEKAGF